MSIRMPRLLDGDLQEKTRLSPLSLSLNMQLFDLSEARMILPPDAPDVTLRDLVELYDEQGSAGIFRVTKVQEDVHLTRTVTLTHGLCTLSDGMVSTTAFTGTVRAALETLLASQPIPRWTVGDVELPEEMTVIFSTEYTDLLTALESLLGMLPTGYCLDFDQSVMPWQLHLRALSQEVQSEGRLSRNLNSVRIALDEESFCTRVYPFGAKTDDERLSLLPLTGSDHLESEQAADWGVISRTFHSDRIFDAPTLRDVALLYLEQHSTPAATITVDALDLSASTTAPLDAFRPGSLCRIALPDSARVFTARICAVEKPDVYGAPQHALLTLKTHPQLHRAGNEIDSLLQQVTASKLLGGTVSEVEDANRAEGTTFSPIVHYYDIPKGAVVLDVRAAYKPDTGVRVAGIRIDDTYLPADVWSGGSFSATGYLKRDELGCILSGQHRFILYPTTGVYDELAAVSSTITLTIIQTE